MARVGGVVGCVVVGVVDSGGMVVESSATVYEDISWATFYDP